MSQIETIMLVTLGFVVAALVALFAGRVIWSYAITLGKRRTERSAPATIAALQAERDQLRAEAAMLSRKLELRLDDLKTRLAEQTAEVSRNRNRIDHLIGEVEKRNAAVAEREEQIAQLNKQIEPLEAELATRTQSMQQLKEQLRNRDDEMAEIQNQKRALEDLVVDNEREIGRLRGDLDTRVQQEREITSEAQTAQQRLQTQIAELTSLSKQIEQQRSDMSKEYDEFARLQAEARQTAEAEQTEIAAKKPRKSSSTAKKSKSSATKTRKTTSKQSSAKPKADEQTEVDEKVNFLRARGDDLEKQIRDAERETDQLQDELKKLDAVWAEKVTALNAVAAQTVEKRGKSAADTSSGDDPDDAASQEKTKSDSGGRSRQNVISLASRIRALQRKSVEK